MKNIILFCILISFNFAGFAQKADSTRTSKTTLRGIAASGTEPLIVIDGNKQYTRGTSSLAEINPGNIEAINILKDSLAIAKYGTDGSAGVIEIQTKNKTVGNNLLKHKPIDPTELKLPGKVSGFSARPLTSSEIPAIRHYQLKKGLDTKAQPLYIVDGKEVADPQLKGDSIKSIDVIKDASALKQYGDKGKNGVVIITTKKAATKKN